MYYAVQYGILFLISYLIVSVYSAPSVSFQIKFWSIVTWVLNFAIALLVPEDVYLSFMEQGDKEQIEVVGLQYLVLYWTVYLLTWTIIPILQSYEDSGDLRNEDRLKRSFKYNAIFYFYMLLGGVALLWVLIYFNVSGDMDLITYLKCLASCWGIFLLMIMMGYALVEIPRSFWLNANYEQYLKYCYKKIQNLDEELSDAYFELKQISSYVLLVKQTTKDQLILEYCTHSLNLIPPQLQDKVPKKYRQFLSQTNYVNQYPFGLQSSIQNHRLLKRNLARHRRIILTQQSYIKYAILYEDIIDAKHADRPLQTPLFQSNKLKHIWYCHLMPLFYKSGSILFGIGSLILLIAQTQVFLTSDSSILGWLLKVQDPQTLRILIFISISFMSYLVYYSLFRIKFANLYGLYKNGSDGPSLMFATINFSRVGVAIVLNFVQMLKVDSIYGRVMQAPEMGLLGSWVIQGMPGVLWLIFLSHYFDVWNKVIQKLKLPNSFDFQGHSSIGNYHHSHLADKYREELLRQKQYFR